MQVVKRNGNIVDFDPSKIVNAITKANENVKEKERATKKEINEIVDYVKNTNKNRILVEDIQDLVEEKLMEFKHYELAKKYIIYRYTLAIKLNDSFASC